MEQKEITAIKYTASDGHLFVNKTLKQQRKALIKEKGKNPFEVQVTPLGTIDCWHEVTIKEACEMQEIWIRPEYNTLKLLYE